MIKALQGLLDYFQRERHHQDDRQDAALMAIYVASQETKIYIERLRRGFKPSRDMEEALARLWQKAAVPIRHFDPDLAERCMFKSEYWLNPAEWSDKDVKEQRIEIERVYQEARGLLTGGVLTKRISSRPMAAGRP